MLTIQFVSIYLFNVNYNFSFMPDAKFLLILKNLSISKTFNSTIEIKRTKYFQFTPGAPLNGNRLVSSKKLNSGIKIEVSSKNISHALIITLTVNISIVLAVLNGLQVLYKYTTPPRVNETT